MSKALLCFRVWPGRRDKIARGTSGNKETEPQCQTKRHPLYHYKQFRRPLRDFHHLPPLANAKRTERERGIRLSLSARLSLCEASSQSEFTHPIEFTKRSERRPKILQIIVAPVEFTYGESSSQSEANAMIERNPVLK